MQSIRARILLLTLVPWYLPWSHAHAQSANTPSVAVFPLSAEYGVEAGVARLLTDNLVAAARESGAFSRVSSAQEIETILGVERQKQLLSCNSSSCMSEIAGALGTDLVLAGNLGKLGESYLINLKLIRTRDAVAVASLSQRTTGNSHEALLDAVVPSLGKVLEQAGLSSRLPATLKDAPGTVASAAKEPEPRGGPPRKPLMLAGGLGVLGWLAGIPLSLMLVSTSLLVLVVPYLVVHVSTPGLPGDVRSVVFPSVSAGLAAPALVGSVLGLVLLVAGVGSFAVGLVAGQ